MNTIFRLLLSAYCWLVLVPATQAQSTCIESESYEVEVISYSSILDESDKTKLSELEKADFILKRERRQVEKCLKADGKVSSEVVLLNPEEVFPEWVNDLPIKAVLNSDSLFWFNGDGEIISRRAKSQASKDTYGEYAGQAQLHGLQLTSFNQVALKKIDYFEEKGFSFVQTTDGHFEGSKTNETVLINPQNLTVSHVVFDGGAQKSKLEEKYQSVPYFALVSSVLESSRTLPFSGVCIMDTRIKLYSNYSSSNHGEIGQRAPNNATADDLIVVPNPAREVMWVRLPDVTTSSKAVVRINSLTGQTLRIIENDQPSDLIGVELTNIMPGLYVIDVSIDGKTYSQRFVKS